MFVVYCGRIVAAVSVAFDDVSLVSQELDYSFNLASTIHRKSSFWVCLGFLGGLGAVLGRSWRGLGRVLGGLGGVLERSWLALRGIFATNT